MENSRSFQLLTSDASEGCKGCSASVHDVDESIDRLTKQIAEDENIALRSEQAYERRLQACHTCDSLQFGTTCSWCGCLVAVKAKKAASTCPHPEGSRW